VMPLVEIAHIMGWYVTIVDGRASHARTDRFPLANRVVNAKPENVLEQVQLDARTVFVLMTHNYNYDIKALRQLIHKPIPYIGLLGPRKKLKRIIDELEGAGELPAEGAIQFLFGPVGLDLGAETPEEIALSIIAEIKAVLSGKSGKSLRENLDTIHPRGEQVIS
jgi:xanthine dehydrogenase accessory factor